LLVMYGFDWRMTVRGFYAGLRKASYADSSPGLASTALLRR
jgi:hypothetical protein